MLGRSKTKYFGAYPAGFLERAREILVGGNLEKSIWHIPGGRAREYNGVKGGIHLWGFGKNDRTIDLDPACNPDFLYDVRKLNEILIVDEDLLEIPGKGLFLRPGAILIDRPYTLDFSKEYVPGPDFFPDLNPLLRECLRIVKPGGRVGAIDFEHPDPGKIGKKPIGRETAIIAVSIGRRTRIRIFTVWKSLLT
ncbi:hypothetical protein EHQ53_14210 [Leptospira langatensis]|uniref:Class I SAM-dependent methyltransferase n=1 Tax=Leptospira langatensis TaxID=2484983 RepID=A0ABY2MDK3_9LEPT|nr:hypothetical protein EHQ53_14210 [Leptospira langatensis]